MKYTNPVIFADYSDPDVIRVGEDFFMVASSFNYVPGVPVLHSRNLVEWELVNYVFDEIPFPRFSSVCSGDGAWAPALRFHNGRYYCVIPFPDEGIYVSETQNIYGKWSPLRPLIVGKGIIDPCPVWEGDKCYLAVAFAKSRTGFNSRIGLYEVSPDLTRQLSDGYKIIYDGSADNPTIEGPKFYKRGGYFYILAPAGGVKDGWQTALRSKNVCGPYESRVILASNGSPVNGPHQGALVDLPDGGWAFIHFQDMYAYGRIVHLQPAVWADGWVACGEVGDPALPGTPVPCGDYPVNVKTPFRLQEEDDFAGDKLSLMWQTPANRGKGWYSLGKGLKLNCVDGGGLLSSLPNIFTVKITRPNFRATVGIKPFFSADGDEAGLAVTGEKYAYLCLRREGGQNLLEIYEGDGISERSVYSEAYRGESLVAGITAYKRGAHDLCYSFSVGERVLPYLFTACAGRWVGAKIGVYARNRNAKSDGKGCAVIEYYRTLNVD